MMWASQIASGYDCGVRIRVFGEKGSLEWRHTRQMELRYAPLNKPVQIMTANKEYCYSACVEQCRLPAGHPEGYYEAFANIYHGYCLHLLEKKGLASAGTFRYPTIVDGMAGLYFADACLKSHQSGNIWMPLENA